jgi:hypothetical protein
MHAAKPHHAALCAIRRRPAAGTALDTLQLPKATMFDKTYDEFDNGLSDLIEFWVSTDPAATQALKDSALAHFKEDLEGAILNWADNKAKSKKYAAIAKELAEFEEALQQG